MEEDRLLTHYHCYVIELNGVLYEMGVACQPNPEDPKIIEFSVLTRTPVPKHEVPEVIVDEFKEWLDGVRRDYHQLYLMNMP